MAMPPDPPIVKANATIVRLRWQPTAVCQDGGWVRRE